jgi:hypothetical protein
MALQKRFNDPRKQFVDPYWTIISGVLSHGSDHSKMTLDRRICVELGVPCLRFLEAGITSCLPQCQNGRETPWTGLPLWRRIQNSKRQTRRFGGCWKKRSKSCRMLTEPFSCCFMLRDVEDMSTTDAADVLEITEENVKVRLHRARAVLRKSLYARAGMEGKEAFSFHAVRCDRVVKNVFERIRKQVSNRDDSTARMQ